MHRLRTQHIVQLAILLTASLSLLAPDQAVLAAPPLLTPMTFVDLAREQRPVVVGISILQISPAEPGQLPDDHPQIPKDREGSSFRSQTVGSGLLVKEGGYVLTNNHVIEQSQHVGVTLWNGEEFTARIIGRDAKSDLALIKIVPHTSMTSPFPVARLGDSDALQVGEWIAAIGNPFGLEQTLTIGILSGKGRALGAGPYEEYLQTDASINPGSSGGPLFNIAGEVIGIATAMNPAGQGIGFAIPINQVKILLPQLIEGKVRRGWIGVMIQENDSAASFGTPSEHGVIVTDVLSDSPAEHAGLQPGDIISEFDGGSIIQLRDLPRRVASTRIGSHVRMQVLREGHPLSLTITIGELLD